MNEDLVDSMKSVQSSIAKMNDSIVNLSDQLTSIQNEMSNMKEIKYSLEFTQAELAEAKSELSEVKTKTFDLLETDKIRRNQLNALKIENDQLKEKILNLDTYIRRENLIFSGLQEEKDESTSQFRKKLRHLFKNQLK